MPVRGVRRRYIHLIADSPSPLTERAVDQAIRASVSFLFGAKGVMDAELSLIEWKEAEQRGILRCRHTEARRIRAALAYVTIVGGQPAAIHVDRVSGTIKRIRLKIRAGSQRES